MEKSPQLSEKDKARLAVLFLIGSVIFFIGAAGGQVVFGENFHGDILLAPAWGMLFVPIFYAVGVKGVNALVAILKAVAVGVANIPDQKEEKGE